MVNDFIRDAVLFETEVLFYDDELRDEKWRGFIF